jgi:hypothetical protein
VFADVRSRALTIATLSPVFAANTISIHSPIRPGTFNQPAERDRILGYRDGVSLLAIDVARMRTVPIATAQDQYVR